MISRSLATNGAALALLASLAAGCSWADFKESGYAALQSAECDKRNQTLPPSQRGISRAADCFPAGDPRALTAQKYETERKRVLGIEAEPRSADLPAATAAKSSGAHRESNSGGTGLPGSPETVTRIVQPEG